MPDRRQSSQQVASTQPAFSDLFAKHARGLLVFFVRRTFDVEAARDLTAETFAQAWQHRASFRGSTAGEEANWLYGIARHHLSRYVRRGRVQRKAVERLGIRLPVVADDDYQRILDLAGVADMRDRVQRAFLTLPLDQREALRLRVVDECAYAEVAATLGVSEQAARARVSRALSRLADAMGVAPGSEAAL
jgi:RNA polymerase sigma factor (sigma-70 family)